MNRLSEFFVGQRPFQMYVQRLDPAPGAPARPDPIIMIHGGMHTGVCWTTIPDGSTGWAPFFADQGWTVFVVDWPGVGRSGFTSDFLTMGPKPIVDALMALLEKVGPSIMIGHSIGGALSLKVADLMPDALRAVVALTSAPISNVPFPIPLRPVTAPFRFTDDDIARFFLSAPRFPANAKEQYLSSLVPLSPSIENELGSRGGSGFMIERLEAIRKIPVLFLVADDDLLVTTAISEPMAEYLGVPHTMIARDWLLEGFGHMLIVERGTLEIAARVNDWIVSDALGRRAG
jgi:pimeloyl-ACP methyl ester carboxylesterase